ncbi:MAG: tol-pal system-associated acyl-CoA thioesterase [Rhodovibrionaceae bacterium]
MTLETPPSGYLEGDEHVLPIRVYYEDTDAAGIVYYANYLKFAERGRTELLRLIGVDQTALRRDHGFAFAVRDCAADYRQPARLDDALQVRSRLAELRGASVRLDQRVVRARGVADEATEQTLVQIGVRVVCLRLADGRAVRLPREQHDIFQAFGDAGLSQLKNATGS